MARRCGVCFLILFLFPSFRIFAINAIVSHTVFYVPDPQHPGKLIPRVDAYWKIKPNSVHYTTQEDKTIIARIRTEITLTSEKGKVTKDQFVLQTVPRTNVSELGRQMITDLRSYEIPAGFTKMRIKLADETDTTNRFVYTDSFTVQAAVSKPFYSEVELLDTVVESGEETVFSKNGKIQVPSCANFLDDNKSVLRYYAELYSAELLPKGAFPLVQRVSIGTRENENPLTHFTSVDTIVNSRQLLRASGTFPLRSLASGNYYLNISLENAQREKVASKSYFFQRLNMHPAEDTAKAKSEAISDTGIERVNVINLNKTFIAKYTLPEVRAMLKMLLPFSDNTNTQTINGFLKNPNELYMRYYVYNHFAAINKDDPGRAWKEFSEKILEANKRFTVHGTPGFETDRGFIFLRYGEPTEIETVENETGALPYEVWQYNTLRQMNGKDVANAVFLFYKPNQMTEGYRILHSTVAGEAQNPAWRTYLYQNAQDVSDMNSKAAQFLGNR